jgi:hypothetical protein
MNYHALQYCELKQEAKERRIKMYYVMRKAQLIELLCMQQLPEKYIIEKKVIGELRSEAQARGFMASRLNRSALLQLLYPHLYGKAGSEYKHKYENNADKHNAPKHYHSQ